LFGGVALSDSATLSVNFSDTIACLCKWRSRYA